MSPWVIGLLIWVGLAFGAMAGWIAYQELALRRYRRRRGGLVVLDFQKRQRLP